MELECDLSKIKNEELLRKMWQQSEDTNRKKEIRSQLYKLRESRLKDLYQGDIMADNSLAGFSKDPLVTSHGDGLADHSFQSLKSKEIRDSLSPTEMKFQSMALNNPNTTGWNVQSSKEVSPDGKGFRAETVATTDGVESVNGGIAEFKGRNEQRSSAHHQGDDKNFVKKAMESSNSHLQEKVVIGDENSGTTEVRTSSSTSTSSSKVIQSTNVEYDEGFPIQQPHPQKYLMDSNRLHQQDLQQRQQLEQERLLEEQRIYEQQFQQQRQQHLKQQEQVSTTRQNTTQKKNISQNIQTQETHEQNKHYVDMDKASPEYQQHVQHLMQQPGEIISNTVEYPKPNVKMITTVKRLPDGTIVRNKRYETEELAPTATTTRPTTAPNQTQPRHDSQQQQPIRNYQPDSAPHNRPTQDMVDSGSKMRYVQDTHTDDIETKFSAIKKSNRKFSTETTSETIQEEYDDHHHSQGEPLSRPKPKNNDFSTHGFPSVRSNKPTQEYSGERPHTAQPKQGFPCQSGPARPTEAVVPRYTDDTDNIIEHRVNTKDGEVIIISSEKKRNIKTSTNSERIRETEHVVRDDHPYQQVPDKRSPDGTTHVLPSVREPSSQQTKHYPYDKQTQLHGQDFPLDKLPPGAQIVKNSHGDEVIVINSQKSHTAKHSTNTERVIEHDIIRDNQQGSYPRIQPNDDYTVTTPGEQIPQREYPASPRKPSNADYSTQGFPSVRTPGQVTPCEREPQRPNNDYSTQGFPSVKTPSRPAAGLPSSHNQHPHSPRNSPSHDYSTQGFPSVRSPSKGTPTQGYPSNVEGGKPYGTNEQPRATPTTKTQPRTPSPNKYKPTNTTVRETTERVIRKEKEVDSAHRAFAASLRSSSPIDHVRRDSYTTDSHTRHTPRSSVSSTRTFRRDMREGSHDSAPSETSRLSTNTITRNTPPRVVGGRTVVTKSVTAKTGHGSNDTLNVTSPRATKSPSPGKTVTTTTTTRTLTSKDVPKVTDNQHTRITTNKIDTIFPINEPPLTSITKIKFSDNNKQTHKKPKNNNSQKNIPVKIDHIASASAGMEEVIEAPCVKKHYYLLGPSDQTQAQLNTKTTSKPLKSPQIYEKSPTKKQSSQPQPAPGSRSSTPSYNSRKPPSSVLVADNDDDNQLNTTSPFSLPSTRSRSPKKIAPNDNDKPQDDWQIPRHPPHNDERRTVNRETTFEKTDTTNFKQPNVEWVIVDDGDDYEDDDNDSFAPEVVDAKQNVKTITTKLITQEKQAPIVPQQRKTKPTTIKTTSVTTKQFQATPSKTQTKPNDRSPLKTKPNDSRASPQSRTPKPFTDSRSPLQTPSRSPTKVVDNKPLTKGIKPSYTSPIRKPLPKTATEEIALKKTLKTSQVLKEKIIKLIDAEKPKRKPQSPERKIKPQTPEKRKPIAVKETNVATEISYRRVPDRKAPQPDYNEPTITKLNQITPYDNDNEPKNPNEPPEYMQPQNIYQEPHDGLIEFINPQANDYEEIPRYNNPDNNPHIPQKDSNPHQYSTSGVHQIPQGVDNKPKHKSSTFRKAPSTSFQKLQSTFIENSPQYGKPYDTDDEPNQNLPKIISPQDTFYEKPENTNDNPFGNGPGEKIVENEITIEETSQQRYPKGPAIEPTQGTHDFQKPKDMEPIQNIPAYIKPKDIDEPRQGLPGWRKPTTNKKPEFEAEIQITEKHENQVFEKETSKKRPQSPEQKPHQITSVTKIQQEIIEEPNQGKIRTPYHDKAAEPNMVSKDHAPEFESFEVEENEECFTENITSHKKVAKHIQKFETNFLQKKSPKPQKNTIPIQKLLTKTPTKEPKTSGRIVSPTRNQKPLEEPNARRPQSPNKHVSPNRPRTAGTEPIDKRPKSPNKHVSPVQNIKKPYENMSSNDEYYTSSLKTSKVLKEKIIREFGGEEYPEQEPKNDQPTYGKSIDTDEDVTFTEDYELEEKHIVEFEKPLHSGKSSPHTISEKITKLTTRSESPTKAQNKPDPAKRTQSPNTHISPTRTQKKPEATLLVDDQTFRKTLRNTELVTETVTKHINDKDHPKDKLLFKKDYKPETKPKGHTFYPEQTSDTEEEEIFTDISEFVTNSTHKQIVNKQEVRKFEEPLYQHSIKLQKPIEKWPEVKSKEPIGKGPQTLNKPGSPKRFPSEDEEMFTTSIKTKKIVRQLSEDKFNAPFGKRPQSPNKPNSPTRTQKKPYKEIASEDEEISFTTKKIVRELPEDKFKEPIGKRPQSPNKAISPTRTQRKPYKEIASEDEEISFTSNKIARAVPEDKFKAPIGKRPQSPNKRVSPTRNQKIPSNEIPSENDELFTSSITTKKIVKEQILQKENDKQIFKPEKDNKSPTREPTRKRPQSPSKPQSPVRNQMQHITDDKTLKNTKYPNEKTPYRKGDKPENEHKPYSDKPFDNEEDETTTETNECFISSKTHMVTEKHVEHFEEPTSLMKDLSPTKETSAQKITDKRPQSIFPEDDDTFTKTTKTTKSVKENISKNIESIEFPTKQEPYNNMPIDDQTGLLQPIEKRPKVSRKDITEYSTPYEEKPKEFKPQLCKPTETDGEEPFTEETEFVFKSTNKPIYPGSREFEETDDNESFVHTSEFIRNTSQKLIETEQQAFETEKELYYLDNKKHLPTRILAPTKTAQFPREQSPTRSPSPKDFKKGTKPTAVNDETFQKSLRTTKVDSEKTKPDLSKPIDTDEEESEELVVEICETNYVTERNITSEEEHAKLTTTLVKPKTQNPNEKTTDEKNLENPLNQLFASTYLETVETIEGQTYPEDAEQIPAMSRYPKNKHSTGMPQEPCLSKQVPKSTVNINEEFIETERIRKETPDGAFVSKTIEPSTPTSPTYKKKGAGRSDTFEERCRQILGMDTYGDTPGSYKEQPTTEINQQMTVATKEDNQVTEKDINNSAVFQVKIEDCDDDEPFSINSVKKTLHQQIYTTEPLKEPIDKAQKNPIEPQFRDSTKEFEVEEEYTENKTQYFPEDKTKVVQTSAKIITVHKKSSKNKSVDETEPDSSESETGKDNLNKKSEVKITKQTSPASSPRSSSPTKSTSSPRSLSPTKKTVSTPSGEFKKFSPNKALPESKLNKKSLEKDDSTTTIKDRLRSSTRKTKSPSKRDQVDGSESSPERSPTRYIERRRSSNISVTTEIIIEHTDSDAPNKNETSPLTTRKPQDSVFKEIVDSTVLPDKLIRRMPVTERKESAPVHRVTNRDKDSKMSRSTSENLIKVKKHETHSTSSETPTKTTDHRRPNKCFATKSINLSATDRLVNSKDMENVVIDIQHAKSSREPSPDKIVPTPVPAHLDTGKPRYPDVVQEPEDDHSKRKPQVTNIPIFEEQHNSYVGCHITEVNVDRSHKSTYDSLDYEEQILNHPVVEAPPSLDYTSLERQSDDESSLTVHEKVSKFQNITKEVNKFKKEPQFDNNYKVPRNDERLVIIKNNENTLDEDEEFVKNGHVYTTVKLAPTAPQKSPELVRTITRNISRQNEPEFNNEANEDYTLTSRNDGYVKGLANNKKTTKEFKVSHHQQTTTETTSNTAEKYQQPQEYEDHDDDELIPHTATHTTKIEERRQKDILSRPSVFDSKNKKPTFLSTATTATKTPLKCNKSPVKDSEKLRPDIKSHTMPTSAVTNTQTTEQTTATTITAAATSKQPKQSPQRKNSDTDYELRGSNIETGVKNVIILKQTKAYKSNNSSSDSKTNDLKKPTTNNTKPEKHMPVRLTPAKNSDEHDDLSADDEMIIAVEEITDIDVESQVVNEDLKKKTNRQIPLTTTTTTTTTPRKKLPTVHSSTNSSPNNQPLKTKPIEHVVKLTDKNPLKSNTVTSTKTYETVERADDIDETVLEPATKKSPSPSPSHLYTKTPKMSTTTTDSVAARRSLFESNNSSPSATPTKRTPLTSPMSGRRPSYMDHTKSSLEHTRRDSLEINKTNYSRKPSHPEDEFVGNDRNSMVKFDVPHAKRGTSVSEDINVEEIFDLEVLEKLLETVQSYEIRRRVRAQIRLIKKNQKNELISSSTEVITRTVKTNNVVSSEEPDIATASTRKSKPEEKTNNQTTQAKETAQNVSSSKKEYIFEEAYHPTTRRSPRPNRSRSPHSPVCQRNAEHNQHYTEVMREQTGSRTTKQQYYYKDEHEHEEFQEIRHETSPSRKSSSPNRKPHSLSTSPERRYASPESCNERSRSPHMKTPKSGKPTSSRSPDTKTSATNMRKPSASYEQEETVKSSVVKPQTKRITTTTTTTTKSKPEDKTPVWADRKNILKNPGSTTPKKPSSSTLDSRTGYTKTVKSTTSQKMTSNKTAIVDDDCVTSSYGIGPTDENGLPLFGIRALKKKKPTVEPSETTEEVTGYVVEEKYYSDNKTKPTVERKEFIYSTNPEQLEKLKEQVETTTNRKALKDVDLKESRQAALISKTTPALRSSPEDDFLDSATKYVRRGSVKEMSEKFIQKEASSTVTEKTNNYPKAGLILRTNSRKSSRDVENEIENFETFKTTRVQHHHSSNVLVDSDDPEREYEVEEVESRHSGRFITESESECDSIKTQREFKQITSSSRSFLNSQGEEKVVTNVSECLERMRNADNVVEEGDTAEDQEARALLNKFLGASIIMKGVESSLPATNRQSNIITTTTTSSNLSDNNDGDNNAKHEVKSTRITKTIKSGSSSTPVTYTTCDIEEIWDEEILKELLEQARTYEERRKIRSRLRELMADREETNNSRKGNEKEATSATEPALAVVANGPEEEAESASEYEEIIEEVTATDYSEAESDGDDRKQSDKEIISEKSQDKNKISKAEVTKTAKDNSSITVTAQSEKSSVNQEAQKEQVEETKTVTKSETEIVKVVTEETSISESDDQTDSSEKGESLMQPMVHNKPQNSLKLMPQETNTHINQSTNSQKLKSIPTSSNSNSKTAVTESKSMHALYNNINNKSLKAPTSSQNPIVTIQTVGRTNPTSITHRNNSNTNTRNTNNDSSSSGSGSLGSNSVAIGNNDKPRPVDRLGVPQKEDSGTESGEDLRLIAAGLRDQLQIQSDSNIIEDVTCALSRLENSLKEGKDISVDIEKRKALLALVARLRAGLTSPEKLAEIAAAMSELDRTEGLYDETSSPEADAHRSNRNRFGKRRNRVNRHTVGVSREELADARRYMEDMLLMSNISQSTTPEANTMSNNTPPQWCPLEKNASTGSILSQSLTPALQTPRQFMPEENANTTYTNRLTTTSGKRRPHSGEYSVSFENPTAREEQKESFQGLNQGSLSEDGSKAARFTNKKHLMKRANTIDLAKTRKHNLGFDTDSDADDKSANSGLKRAVQVSVKKRVQNVVPPFEPKTENDRKFLAFINKQSDKPGLGWTASRSVSNWTNKFGSIKSTFEGGLIGKPPLAPHHVSVNTRPQQFTKLFTQPTTNNVAPPQTSNHVTNHQIALRLQREAERQAEERRRKLEKEHLEHERRERDKLERQRQQRERQERERLEREHFERQRREQDQITAAQHAAIFREQEQLAVAQQAAAKMNVPQTIPINEFKHAPQSVFRPIDSAGIPSKPIYKPIPQLPRNAANNWQTFNAVHTRSQAHTLTATPPGQSTNTRPDNSFITSPPPSSRSPIILPWASKPTVDNSSFKSKAHKFEERSKYDNINATPPIQRHNSLRSTNDNSNNISDDFRKRPSLPNAFNPCGVRQMQSQQDPLAYLPPPQNISFTYSSLKPKTTYQSYPCLPSAVVANSRLNDYPRPREDSLTNPQAVPLVLTSSYPTYCAPAQALSPQLQPHQQQLNQAHVHRHFDLVSPADSAPASPSIYNMQQTDFTDDDLDSDNNLLEYRAVSRVMGKPQSQTAVTVGRRTGHISDDELFGKNSRAAKNLLTTIKSLGNSNGVPRTRAPTVKNAETISSPRTCLSPDGRSYQAPIVEPLFPEINKFEANRKPLYADEPKKQASASTYSKPMYKSMENLNRSTEKGSTNFTQSLSPKPHVSETQTSYVVTYPIEDTTDDEDFSRQSQKKIMPPNNLDLRRHRNVSENSTSSSTPTSMSFSQNLPSPNTSWTSNPIVLDESNKYQHMSLTTGQNDNKNLPADPPYQARSSQVTSYPNNVKQTYNPTTSNYTKVAAECEEATQRYMQQSPVHPTYNGSANQTQSNTTPTSKSFYEGTSQRQFQQQQSLYQNTGTNQKATPQQAPKINQKPALTQKPTDYSKQILTKTATSAQEKKSLSSMQKSEDHQSLRGTDQTGINPKNSNISQEMLTRLDQQRERISNEMRRKSLGNTLDYQMEKEARYEAQNTQIYKSSAPSDTPDIVKSSLPKDETQPILKKFGPPQRHLYMPNSYQSPSTNATSTSIVATSKHSTKLQGDNLQSTSRQTIVNTSQHFSSNTRPTVMETPATPQPDDDYIPRNIVFNNVHAFSSMNRRLEDESNSINQDQYQAVRPNKLSKSDSWNQIIMLQNQHAPTNTTRLSPTNDLRRSKSGHTLALPKMFEAAMTKTDISEKQKTVAAYFSGQKSPTQQETMVEQLQHTTTKRSVINRIKTSDKVSAASRKSLGSNVPVVPGGLQRSATMPHIANVNLLDESNVEDAFEQLIMEQKQQKSSSSTTEKTETKEKDGAVVTTTTKVTTRTVTGSAAKPASPFAKFKQLDKQNSQQSAKSPTTPTTPVGGSTASVSSGNQPIFKFTDPALNAKAATVKEQLLQWCQSKTQEYENIEITNFSTSWNNGLAFCALIHHFLPDAFDYSQLTPKNRRRNFELAFTVAESPTTPTTPVGGSTASVSSGNQPIFKFTDPALNAKAATVKEQLLQWCQSKTQEYENIEITNFSTSWNNGLAFCALIHHFLPDAFDYSQLTPKNRRRNFELAFTVADEKAGIAPLLDVEDMVVMQRPDWKCVFVYVQSIYRRFRNCQ